MLGARLRVGKHRKVGVGEKNGLRTAVGLQVECFALCSPVIGCGKKKGWVGTEAGRSTVGIPSWNQGGWD